MATSDDSPGRGFLDRLFAWYWERRAARATDLSSFRRLALRRRATLDRVAHRAEQRLAREKEAPLSDDDAIWTLRPEILSLPQSPTIWVNPESGVRPAPGLSIYHDGADGAFTLAQRPNRTVSSGQRYELFFESYEFQGAYLSLAINTPPHLRRPKAGEVLRVEADIAASRTLKTFLRLNIKGAGVSDTLHEDAEAGSGRLRAEFDMSFAAFEPGENDMIWLDLIFDRPRMVEVAIRDLSLSLCERSA
ncbi:MAG: DUF6478 family protein [Pseudomonadota bacterium]